MTSTSGGGGFSIGPSSHPYQAPTFSTTFPPTASYTTSEQQQRIQQAWNPYVNGGQTHSSLNHQQAPVTKFLLPQKV